MNSFRILVRAFLVYVHPILEYNSVVWSPQLIQDITRIEKVQRQFTKRLRGFRNLCYADRLTKLDLPSLELRRLQLDLIYCYKIVFGLVKLNYADFFEFSTVSSTRGHKYKLYKPRCSNVRIHFFSPTELSMSGTVSMTLSVLQTCMLSSALSSPSILVIFKKRFLTCISYLV